MLLMKLVKYCFLVLCLWLVTGVAQAQTCPISPTPSDCNGVPFQAFIYDASAPGGRGAEVQSFCVGQTVTFASCPSRNITQLRYGVLQGTNTTFPGCNVPANPVPPAPFLYTPTRADVGIVTVSELANANASGTIVGGVYLIRTFRVYDNPAPTFTVAPCPSNFALVTIQATNPYDSYTYTVQSGAGSTAPQPIGRSIPTSVPLPAGATSITVTGTYNIPDVCAGISPPQTITPLPSPQTPTFTRLTLQTPLPSTATLDVGNLPAGYLYSLQIADATVAGGYRFVARISENSTTFSLNNAVAGCYRLRRTDVCQRDSAFSPLICTVTLTGASARNRNQLLLNDAGNPGTTYTVTRDNNVITGLTVIPGGLEDPNVQCGTSYTYRVTALQPGGGTSVSNPVTILTQSTIPPLQPQLIASFNLNDVVEVSPLLATPTLPAGTTLRYRRSTGGQPATTFGTATTIRAQRDSTALADLLALPPCYTVQAIDVCVNASPESNAGCPALLTARPADANGSTAALTWTPFTGPNPSLPATYTLERLAANGTAIGPAIPVTGGSYTDLTPPTDRQVLRYRLKISGAGLPTGIFSYSNRASVTRQLSINIPTAFTPNGDGLNDVLEVKGKYLENYTFVVVDRNGQEVFRGTKRSETWDGTIKGHAPVLGAYVWRFQQDGEDGKTFTATGAVTILK